MEQEAAAAFPLGEEAYLRLRVHSVVDQLSRNVANSVCDLPEGHQGPRASLYREIVERWAERQGLLDPVGPATCDRADFLDAYDLGYLRRNLRFVEGWIAEQYGLGAGTHGHGLRRDQLDRARRAISRRIDEISGVLRADRLDRLGEDVVARLAALRSLLCEPTPDGSGNSTPREQAAAFLDAHGSALDEVDAALRPALLAFQDDILADLYADFTEQTARWENGAASRAVLARYLGFPYWDRVAYPYTAFSGTGDLTEIEVVRFSPEDALDVSENGSAKLVGSTQLHFGAFLGRRGARELDYLWGRLDGAEHVLELIGGQPADGDRLRREILDEERQDAVVGVRSLESIAACVAAPGSC